MAPRTDLLDLGGLRLGAGEARRFSLEAELGDLELGSEKYAIEPNPVAVTLDAARLIGGGYALRLRFGAAPSGRCMRCLEPAAPASKIDVREISQPDEGEELECPYVDGDVLDLQAWARDALALALPATIVCHPDCAGLCPVCGADLNHAGPDHRHEATADPRWAKLSELRFDP